MNVIHAYLDTMFSAYPSTPRMLEAKDELRTMMEDAYTGFIDAGLSENEAVGKVITEFGNLDELAPVLGISAEIAPSAPTHSAGTPGTPGAPAVPSTPAYAPLTITEAQEYADAQRDSQPRLARAVALFIISPAPLIALATLGSSGFAPFSEQVGSLIGLILLLVIVALGISMAIRHTQTLTRTGRVSAGTYVTSDELQGWADALTRANERRRVTALQISVTLWVLAVLPVLIVSLLPVFDDAAEEAWIGVAVALMLGLVATGILVFLPTTWANAATETIRANSRSVDGARTEQGNLVGVIASIYWPLLAAIFLAWSFIGNAWDRSWIIWPIGGVLFGAIGGGISSWETYRENRRARETR